MQKRIAILATASAIALLLTVGAYPQGRGGGGGGAAGGGFGGGGGAAGGAAGGATGAAGGQTGANNNGATQTVGSLTGQVLSATTGEPLRKVSVSLQPQGGRGGQSASASSDTSGSFHFDNVQPGTYTLSGERTGYVRGTYGQDRPGNQALTIEVTSGQTKGGIQLKLQPQAVVTGRVFDLDGDPVQGAEVQMLRYTYSQRGQRELRTEASANTNDLGEYRIPNLTPGRYYVAANDRGVLNNLRGAIRGGGNNGGFPGGNNPGGNNKGGAPGGNNNKAGGNTTTAAGGNNNGGRGKGRGGRGNTTNIANVIDQLLGADSETYVTTYYSRTIELSGATPMDLAAGSELSGIDIGLQKGHSYTVSGVVEGAPAAAVAPLQAQNNNKGGNNNGGGNGGGNNKGGGKGKGNFDPGGNGGVQIDLIPRTIIGGDRGNQRDPLQNGLVQVNNDNTFQIKNVHPGSYYLRAQTRGNGNDRFTGREAIDITSSDLNNVHIRLNPRLDVTGKIVAPSTMGVIAASSTGGTGTTKAGSTGATTSSGTVNLQQVRVNFVSTSQGGAGGGRGGGGNQRTDTQADGTFTQQLDTDTYSIELQGGANGIYLKQVKLQGQVLPDNILDLTFSGAQLELDLANDSGSIKGTVTKSSGDPVQNAKVTAVPTNNSIRRDFYKSSNSAADGTFTLSGLPPGSYKIFAWEQVDQNAWMDPDYRMPYDSLGVSATVKDGAGPTDLTLRLIGAEQMKLQ